MPPAVTTWSDAGAAVLLAPLLEHCVAVPGAKPCRPVSARAALGSTAAHSGAAVACGVAAASLSGAARGKFSFALRCRCGAWFRCTSGQPRSAPAASPEALCSRCDARQTGRDSAERTARLHCAGWLLCVIGTGELDTKLCSMQIWCIDPACTETLVCTLPVCGQQRIYIMHCTWLFVDMSRWSAGSAYLLPLTTGRVSSQACQPLTVRSPVPCWNIARLIPCGALNSTWVRSWSVARAARSILAPVKPHRARVERMQNAKLHVA